MAQNKEQNKENWTKFENHSENVDDGMQFDDFIISRKSSTDSNISRSQDRYEEFARLDKESGYKGWSENVLRGGPMGWSHEILRSHN